ncbi:MAG TPA: hypothetical protein VGL61_30210 [Kofleriaceae bacterium]
MRAVDPAELGWLHDAACPSITIETAEGVRTLRLVVDVHPDAGNPALDGKRLAFVARDVLALELRTYNIAGIQEINSFRLQASPSEMFRKNRELAKLPVDVPEYQIWFSSGEHLGFICRELLVDELLAAVHVGTSS